MTLFIDFWNEAQWLSVRLFLLACLPETEVQVQSSALKSRWSTLDLNTLHEGRYKVSHERNSVRLVRSDLPGGLAAVPSSFDKPIG